MGTVIHEHSFVEVKSAKYVGDYKIFLRMSDGADGVVDLEKELWGEMFEPLKNKEYFKKFKVSRLLGTICWPNGADIAPEFLRENLK